MHATGAEGFGTEGEESGDSDTETEAGEAGAEESSEEI